jgi:hypothetical protein
MSCPSNVMVPDVGLYHLSSRPMMVLFPEPLGPCVCVSSVFLAWTDDQAWALPVGTHDKSGDLPRGDIEGEVF